MKKYLKSLLLLFCLASVSFPALILTAQNTAPIRTLDGWIDFIKTDAKLRSLQQQVGLPDKKVEGDVTTALAWYNKVDNGTTSGATLEVAVQTIRGEEIIIGIYDTTSSKYTKFPWAPN